MIGAVQGVKCGSVRKLECPILQAGYLPTRRARDGGYYRAVTKLNWVGPEGGNFLVDETVGVIDPLFETEGSMQPNPVGWI